MVNTQQYQCVLSKDNYNYAAERNEGNKHWNRRENV